MCWGFGRVSVGWRDFYFGAEVAVVAGEEAGAGWDAACGLDGDARQPAVADAEAAAGRDGQLAALAVDEAQLEC